MGNEISQYSKLPTSPPPPNAQQQKKRMDGVRIALAVFVIILACAAGFMYYQYSQVSSQLSSLQTSFDNLQIEKDNLQTAYANLTGRYNDLVDIMNLSKEQVYLDHSTINQQAGSYTGWTLNDVRYAGYITVIVYSSSSSNTYAEVLHNSGGSSWDLKHTIGTSGSAIFPILPASSVEVRLGNTNLVSPASHTISIIFNY